MTGASRTVSVAEAANVLGVHRLTLYRAIRRDEIKVVRVGRRVLIPLDTIDRILSGDPWTSSPTRSGGAP